MVIWGAASSSRPSGVGGTKPGGLNTIYDTHQVAIATGLVLVVVYYVRVLPGAQGLEMQRAVPGGRDGAAESTVELEMQRSRARRADGAAASTDQAGPEPSGAGIAPCSSIFSSTTRCRLRCCV